MTLRKSILFLVFSVVLLSSTVFATDVANQSDRVIGVYVNGDTLVIYISEDLFLSSLSDVQLRAYQKAANNENGRGIYIAGNFSYCGKNRDTDGIKDGVMYHKATKLPSGHIAIMLTNFVKKKDWYNFWVYVGKRPGEKVGDYFPALIEDTQLVGIGLKYAESDSWGNKYYHFWYLPTNVKHFWF